MLEGYDQRTFSAPINVSKGTDNKPVSVAHDVYTKQPTQPNRTDSGMATVVIIQELPGIGPETLSLADQFVARGFQVVLPHLFGPLGKISLAGNTVRVFCMRKEFRLFAKQGSSPIVDWLRALCADLKANHNAAAVGAIGMCLTGNFAISLMADEHVLAGVASQPAMPLNDQSALHMSAPEIEAIRGRLDTHGPMLAVRFENDKLCQAAKFNALDQAFNDDKERIKLITLPGDGHSVLTLDLIKRSEVAEPALQEIMTYFEDKLGATR